MACPFFAPTDRAHDLALPHPSRLPLGAAWRGTCAAAGDEQATPTEQQLEACNLGYATSCPRLPKNRTCDAVRFAVATDSGGTVSLHFAFELNHLPAGHGLLEYDCLLKSWIAPHPEARTQKLAESFLQSYLERRTSTMTRAPAAG